MKIITKAALAKLVTTGNSSDEFKKKWTETFIGDFEQSYVYSVMKGDTPSSKEEEKKVSFFVQL